MPALDGVLEELILAAGSEAGTLGLLLQGSRANGDADAESDYDILWVLTDPERKRRVDAGDSLHVKQERRDATLDLAYTSPSELAKAAQEVGWWSYGLGTSVLLLDKTGEVARLHRSLVELPEERARERAAAEYDGYLNGFYRSLKAWRRGDELAGRIEAAESVMYLVRTLFALERRWAPYPKELRARLRELDPQGWEPGSLERVLHALVSSGDPVVQQRLEERVAALLGERGFGHVVAGWSGEIERVRAVRF